MQTFELRKFVAPELLMGTDVRLIAGNYFNNFNVRKVFVVTDKTICELDWFEEVLESLEIAGVEYVIYNNVSPNSPDIEVMDGVEIFREHNCDGIFAIGGGSVIDSAKGIGIVYSNQSHILQFEGVDQVRMPSPPIICLPTTAGTSSDVSQFAIIRDTNRKVKIAIVSKSLVPDLSLIDPHVSGSMDNYLTACTGMDALTHAIEAFVSNGNSTVTDFHALNAIELIVNNLHKVYANPDNIELRYNMMIGSLEAGLAFSNASLGAVHAIAHSLGGLYNSPHGECNALLLPYVINYNYNEVPNRFNKVGELMGLSFKGLNESKRKTLLFNKVMEFKAALGLDYSLGNLGVSSADNSLVATNAMNDACIITNPRKANDDDLKSILGEAI